MLLDRYKLTLLVKDMFTNCNSHDELMDMYSDCCQIAREACHERNEIIQCKNTKWGRWCDELHKNR